MLNLCSGNGSLDNSLYICRGTKSTGSCNKGRLEGVHFNRKISNWGNYSEYILCPLKYKIKAFRIRDM